MKGLKKFRKFCADNPKTAKDTGALAALTFLDASEELIDDLQEWRRDNAKARQEQAWCWAIEKAQFEKEIARLRDALQKVATCKDDNHAMLKLLGGIAHAALAVTQDEGKKDGK